MAELWEGQFDHAADKDRQRLEHLSHIWHAAPDRGGMERYNVFTHSLQGQGGERVHSVVDMEHGGMRVSAPYENESKAQRHAHVLNHGGFADEIGTGGS